MAYEVHSYHLNIDSGDSAIHALVTRATNGNVTPKSFVLVDGGFNNYGGWWIEYYLKCLKNIYYPNSNDVVQFDAIVITHWDADHCGGIIELFDGQMKADGPAVAPAWELWFTRFQPSFCKFENNKPLTHLYVPYWSKWKSNTATIFGCDVENYPDGWVLDESALPHVLRLERKNPRIGKTTTTTLPNSKKKIIKPSNNPELRSGAIAIVHDTPETMLGFDIFRNTSALASVNITTITEPLVVSKGLYAANGPPAMFCLLADSEIVGSAQKNELEQWTWDTSTPQTPVLKIPGRNNPKVFRRIEPTKQNPGVEPHGVGLIRGETTTAVNQSSIACMIIWPHQTKAVISHYFAGDVGDAIESMAIKWSTALTPGNTNQRTPNKVLATKLSHHGAKGSTPEELVYAFDPELMVVSNGMKQEWNHPSKWISTLLTIPDNRRVLRLWSANHPQNLRLFYSCSLGR
jgi:hypothetical protein